MFLVAHIAYVKVQTNVLQQLMHHNAEHFSDVISDVINSITILH